jgi:hypothetical protein
MNFTPIRLLHGFLGAFLGAGLYCLVLEILDQIAVAGGYLRFYNYSGHLNITTIIIVAVVSFIVSFFWLEQIMYFLLKDRSFRKEKDHERDE